MKTGKIFLIRFFILSVFQFSHFWNLSANHIVGGEIYVSTASGNNYTLGLNLYFDAINGDVLAQDPLAVVAIFSKADNSLMDTFRLRLRGSTLLIPPNSTCSAYKKKTLLLKYYKDVVLDTLKYKSSAGYYIVWQRCCRNGTIGNILNPLLTGSTFYAEFPSPKVYVNSTPKFSDAQEVFACTGSSFSFDMNATDADGDSLAYELITPFDYSKRLINILKIPDAGPYSPVSWRDGYSQQKQILDSFRLDGKTGKLYFKPVYPGIFTVALACKEYRNGIYLGKVQRDYQILVADCFNANAKPIFSLFTNAADKSTKISDGDTVDLNSFSGKCIVLQLTDTTSGGKEMILKVKDGQDLTSVTPNPVFIKNKNDTSFVNICFDKCSDYFLKQTIVIENSNRCEASAFDSLSFFIKNAMAELKMQIIPDPSNILIHRDSLYVFKITVSGDRNSRIVWDYANIPGICTFSGFNNGSSTITGLVYVYEPYVAFLNRTISLAAKDTTCPDTKNVSAVYPLHFSNKLSNKNKWITFDNAIYHEDDTIKADFSASNVCMQLNYSGLAIYKNLPSRFEVIREYPTVSMDIRNITNASNTTLTAASLCMNACRFENRFLHVSMVMKGNSTCSNVLITDTFNIVVENTSVYEQVSLTIDPPLIEHTVYVDSIFTVNVHATGTRSNSFTLNVGSDLNLKNFFKVNSAQTGTITGTLSFIPDCSWIKDGFHNLVFEAIDSACIGKTIISSALKLSIKDNRDTLRPFIPNVFTPNGDHINDTYFIPSLPIDICLDSFVDFRVFNRWGTLVFNSNEKKFIWNGEGVTDGLYYYSVNYTKTKYTGWIQILR